MKHGYNPDLVTADQAAGMRIAVVATKWNSHIVNRLRDGALETLAAIGVDTDLFTVPGAVELTYAAQRLADTDRFDAIIVLGCVIKGDTPHFDYVCQSVTRGITALNTDGPVPVVFGVLTVLNECQALDRCGGPAGHKGIEAAHTAVAMARFARMFDE